MTNKHQRYPNFCHVFILLFLYLLLLLRPVRLAAAQPANGSTEGLTSQNFKPSMSITIIVLIAAFVFMGFFSIYIRQCTRDNRSSGGAGPLVGPGRPGRVARGLDSAEIGAFPTFVYSAVKGLKIGKGALECAVCLNEFEDDETLRLLPKCDHVFHLECIDAWLASHVTCPVCRANLGQKAADETAGADATEVAVSDPESESENRSSEINESQNHVSIPVIDVQNGESQSEVITNAAQTGAPSRPIRSKSTGQRFPAKFPRSHTTGHSLLQAGTDCDRFTLRLPDDIRKQILSGKLNRTTSCVTFTTRQASVSGGSTRRGYRTGSTGGSSRGRNYLFGMFDRAARPEGGLFSRTRSFFRRTPSVTLGRTPSVALGKRVDGSVKSPFDCIGAKADGDEQQPSSARPPV